MQSERIFSTLVQGIQKLALGMCDPFLPIALTMPNGVEILKTDTWRPQNNDVAIIQGLTATSS